MARRILVADPVATNRMLLAGRLRSALHEVCTAETADEVLTLLARETPSLIILDDTMTTADGTSLCRALKSVPRTEGVPLIAVTGRSDEEAGIRALDAGADEFLAKPVDEITLLARVRSLLRVRETRRALERRRVTCEELGFAEPAPGFAPQGRIAVVTSDAAAAEARISAIRGLVRDRIDIVDARAALALAGERGAPDLFLIDADLGAPRAGLGLLSDLRSREHTRHAAILVVHAREARRLAAEALDLGANDVVADGCPPAELAIRLRTQLRRKQDAERLRDSVDDGLRLAVTDSLTGLYNRRYALTHLGRIAEGAARSKRPFAIILADIDRFKDVNDRFGHGAGDRVLASVARLLRDNLRDVDLVARFGGEEFLIALPESGPETARGAAERLRSIVAGHAQQLSLSESASVTVSLGVAVGDPARGSLPAMSDLIEEADRALYAAKAAGRNRVVLAVGSDQGERRSDLSRRSA